MSLRWTTITAVRAHLDSYDTNGMSDAEGQRILEHCEQYVRDLLHDPDETIWDSFDGDAMRLVAECAEVRAALIVLGATSGSGHSLAEMQTLMDMLSYVLEGDLKILGDQNYIDRMKER